MTPLVSVVTPVYNGERHLEECIQSVLRQTCSDWEYVIVDNVSTDNTAAIADRFAAQDPRIKVVHATEFLDIWGNHNRALQHIDRDSQFCKFVQADDWMYPECLERMLSVAQRTPSVGIVSAFGLSGMRVDLDGLFPYWQEVMPGPEALRRLLLGSWMGWVVGGPSCILLRADLVRRQPEFFDRSIWHADADAAFRQLVDSDLGFVHQVLTFMRAETPSRLTSFSWRVYSFLPMEGRMLIRYGRRVMSPTEYRAGVRRWFRRYARWLVTQCWRPSRLRQKEFQEFHAREIEAMLAEAVGDRETRALLSLIRRLVHSRSGDAGPSRTPASSMAEGLTGAHAFSTET